MLQISLPCILNSVLCPITALLSYLHPVVPNQKHILLEKWHLIQNQPSLWQIFKVPPLISFKMGKPLSLAYESETFKRPMAANTVQESEPLRNHVSLSFLPKFLLLLYSTLQGI